MTLNENAPTFLSIAYGEDRINDNFTIIFDPERVNSETDIMVHTVGYTVTILEYLEVETALPLEGTFTFEVIDPNP